MYKWEIYSTHIIIRHIMRIMCFFLYHKTQAFHFPAVFRAGGHDINAGGIDAAVPQNIRQLGNVFFLVIECPGKQFPQIVGENL